MRKSKQVKIPFLAEFESRLLNGKKTATTRPRRYAWPGDWFQVFGATFLVKEVVVCNLHMVARDFYRQEGFDAPEEFMGCWLDLHPKKGWVGSQQVYLHIFERTDRNHEPGPGTGQAGLFD